MTPDAAAAARFLEPKIAFHVLKLFCVKNDNFVQKLHLNERHGFVSQFYSCFRPITIYIRLS
jgi:hypothetical protein